MWGAARRNGTASPEHSLVGGDVSNSSSTPAIPAVSNRAIGNGRNGAPAKRARPKAKAEPTQYYEIDSLEVIPARWAGELSRELRMRNALRDPTREPPQLIFADEEAWAA